MIFYTRFVGDFEKIEPMKFGLLSILSVLTLGLANAQTTIWTENFNNSCGSGCSANVYNGPNGAWSVTSQGTNGDYANEWYVSGAECGMQDGQCGTSCTTAPINSSLHIGSNVVLMGIPVIVDPGAAYLSGAAGLGGDATTNKRAESPVFSTVGFNNVTISFTYIENGQGATDNAQLWLFNGATWALLSDMPKTMCCGNVPCTGTEQGLWANFSANLPASAFDNPNVRIGFLWVNNNDDVGTDPSVAIDNIVIEGDPIGGGGGLAPIADFTFSPNSTCVGANVLFTDASTNIAGASYSWDFGPNATPTTANTVGPHNVVFSAVGNQTITLTVTTPEGSDVSTQTYTVTNGPNVTASAAPPQICENGSTTLTGGGANAYTWDNGLGIGASHVVSPTQTTTYTVTGLDFQGCSATATVTVIVSGLGPELTMSSVDAACFGTPSGQASVVAIGNGPFQYLWSPIGGINPTATNLFPTNYTVAVTDANGCISTGMVTVGAPTPIQPNAQITNTNCNAPTGSILLNPEGGAGSYSYSWLPGGSTQQFLNELAPGNYQVTITDGNNCSQPFNFSISPNNNFLVEIDPTTSNINYQENVPLSSTVTPQIPGATYSWTPTTGLSCSNCPDPIASPTQNTTYTLTVTHPNGCTQSAQTRITVNLPCGSIFMPTIFSPNGDFLNDKLCVMGACVEFMTYTIYNRWGEVVFTSNNQEDCWNGSFRGVPAPNGVYAYRYQVTLTDGSMQEGSGNVTLVR